MNSKNKIISLLLVIVMLVGILASCEEVLPGGENSGGNNSENNGSGNSGSENNGSGNSGSENNGSGNSGSENNNSGETDGLYDYSITVVNGMGDPVSNVIIKFADAEGNLIKTAVTDKDGTAYLNDVTIGTYNVTVDKGFSSLVIDQAEYQLTAEKRSLCLTFYDETRVVEIYGNVPDGTVAYEIGVGSFELSLESDGASYFVFYAREAGEFNFSVDADCATVGYYGNPMFVLTNHIGSEDYDGKSFDITVQDIGTPYVIGVKSSEKADVTLNIVKAGDAPFDPTYAEWTTVESTANLSKCDTTGKTLVDFDIADSSISVTVGDDGCYYTNDGKLVYVRITTTTGYGTYDENLQFAPLINGSLALLAGHVDPNVGTNFGGYVYDDDGNFIAKYSYNNMIKTYMGYVDSTYGVVPLTRELAEGIKLHGNRNGWWDSTSYGYLFDGIRVHSENAWLFLCMVEQ